jgi:RND family efflux transporter MFP subunit
MSDQLSSDLASLAIPREAKPAGRWARWLITSVVVVGLGLTGYFVGVPALTAKVFRPQVSLTEVTLLSPAHESVRLTAAGYVVPQILSKVSAKVEGRIARANVKEGDRVKAGDVLFVLEDSEPRARLAATQSRVGASRASVEVERAQLEEVRRQAERQDLLAKRGADSRATAEDLRLRQTQLEGRVRAAEAQVRVAQAETEAMRVGLELMTIRAPVSGVVVTKAPSVGDLVGPLSGTIIELADFSSLVVEADVPENRLPLARIGAPCEIILDAFPDRRLRGVVLELGKRVNRAKATLVVRVKFVDPTDGVLPEMAARVGVLDRALDERAIKEPPRLVVPAAAVAVRGGNKVVFVVEDAHARMQSVTLGAQVGSSFQLLAGPPAGTRLVRDPPAELSDGAAIKQRNE